MQIAGALGIVAFHLGAPCSDSFWIAVELFFVIAGLNMAKSLDRAQSIHSYVGGRIRRLGPEVLAVWSATLIVVTSGEGSPGMLWFVLTGPVFLQNLTLPFFDYTMPNDWTFGPLWFVGALLQLQLLLFALRKLLVRLKPGVLIVASAVIGMSFRLAVAALSGESLHSLSAPTADALYCLPLTHLEAIVLGLLIGRGALPRFGRLFPLFCVMAIALGAVNLTLSPVQMSLNSLGFAFPLRVNYVYVWGYLILALTAASLCTPTGGLAVGVEGLTLPGWADKMLVKIASLTYGVYAFHGLIMATGMNAGTLLAQPHAPGLRLLLFAITVVQAFLIAWGFDLIVRRHGTPASAGSESPVPAEAEALDEMPRAGKKRYRGSVVSRPGLEPGTP